MPEHHRLKWLIRTTPFAVREISCKPIHHRLAASSLVTRSIANTSRCDHAVAYRAKNNCRPLKLASIAPRGLADTAWLSQPTQRGLAKGTGQLFFVRC